MEEGEVSFEMFEQERLLFAVEIVMVLCIGVPILAKELWVARNSLRLGMR